MMGVLLLHELHVCAYCDYHPNTLILLGHPFKCVDSAMSAMQSPQTLAVE